MTPQSADDETGRWSRRVRFRVRSAALLCVTCCSFLYLGALRASSADLAPQISAPPDGGEPGGCTPAGQLQELLRVVGGEPPEVVLAQRRPCVGDPVNTPAEPPPRFPPDVAVYDVFPFNAECDVLELRLRELAPSVTLFVVVESVFNEQGRARHLVFHEPACAQRWAFARDKLVYVVGDDAARLEAKASTADPLWQYYFMSYVLGWRALKKVATLRPDDLIISGDLDELVSAASVRHAVETSATRLWITDSTFFMYDTQHCFDSDWPPTPQSKNFRFPVMARASELAGNGDEQDMATVHMRVRAYKHPEQFGVAPQGAHISWRKGVVDILLKLESNAEQHDQRESSPLIQLLRGAPTVSGIEAFFANIEQQNGNQIKPQYASRFRPCAADVWLPAFYRNNSRRFIF